MKRKIYDLFHLGFSKLHPALCVAEKVNISQMADKVGYIDQAHFTSAFKIHFGMSPKEFVEANRKAES